MKIGIVGLGLIGGSLAKDLKSQGIEVLGVSRRENTCKIALEKNIVTTASTDLSILKNTEIIFICTPINAIAPTLKLLIPYLKPETIVTDVGSVKAPIVKECTKLWHLFIGGHPMAGTENKGIEAAQHDLFKGASYVLTPSKITSEKTIEKVTKIIQLIGSKIYICEPEIHDQAVALISHLPVMISANLIKTCISEKEQRVLELAQNLASSGFRDTSRVGGGNPELGLMMAKYNRKELLASMHQYQQNLDEMITHIEQENWHHLEEILTKTNKALPPFLHLLKIS